MNWRWVLDLRRRWWLEGGWICYDETKGGKEEKHGTVKGVNRSNSDWSLAWNSRSANVAWDLEQFCNFRVRLRGTYIGKPSHSVDVSWNANHSSLPTSCYPALSSSRKLTSPTTTTLSFLPDPTFPRLGLSISFLSSTPKLLYWNQTGNYPTLNNPWLANFWVKWWGGDFCSALYLSRLTSNQIPLVGWSSGMKTLLTSFSRIVL